MLTSRFNPSSATSARHTHRPLFHITAAMSRTIIPYSPYSCCLDAFQRVIVLLHPRLSKPQRVATPPRPRNSPDVSSWPSMITSPRQNSGGLRWSLRLPFLIPLRDLHGLVDFVQGPHQEAQAHGSESCKTWAMLVSWMKTGKLGSKEAMGRTEDLCKRESAPDIRKSSDRHGEETADERQRCLRELLACWLRRDGTCGEGTYE